MNSRISSGNSNWLYLNGFYLLREALPAGVIQPDGQTIGFNQLLKEETHALLSKHALKHTWTLLDLKLYIYTRHQQTCVSLELFMTSLPLLLSLLSPLLNSSSTSSLKRLEASSCKKLQSTTVKWTSRQAYVDSQLADLKGAKHSQLWHLGLRMAPLLRLSEDL